jgi:hypothetical protein
MMLRWMWIGALDLDEAFRAYRLITASCFVEIWWIVKETDGTL